MKVYLIETGNYDYDMELGIFSSPELAIQRFEETYEAHPSFADVVGQERCIKIKEFELDPSCLEVFGGGLLVYRRGKTDDGQSHCEHCRSLDTPRPCDDNNACCVNSAHNYFYQLPTWGEWEKVNEEETDSNNN